MEWLSAFRDWSNWHWANGRLTTLDSLVFICPSRRGASCSGSTPSVHFGISGGALKTMKAWALSPRILIRLVRDGAWVLTSHLFIFILFQRERERRHEQERGGAKGKRKNLEQAPCSVQSPMRGSISRPCDRDLSRKQESVAQPIEPPHVTLGADILKPSLPGNSNVPPGLPATGLTQRQLAKSVRGLWEPAEVLAPPRGNRVSSLRRWCFWPGVRGTAARHHALSPWCPSALSSSSPSAPPVTAAGPRPPSWRHYGCAVRGACGSRPPTGTSSPVTVRSAAPEASRRVASGWDNLPLAEAVQPAREGLARKELREKKKMQPFPRDSAYSSNKGSPCLLTERDALGTGLPSLSPFPGTISFGSFSDSSICTLGAECCSGFQQFQHEQGKCPPAAAPCRSGSGCHCWVQIREAFALESRKVQLFSAMPSGLVRFGFDLVVWSKVAITAKGYQWQIPGPKQVGDV